MNRLLGALLALAVSISVPVAAQQPLQWKYSFDAAGVAVATYPADTRVEGTLRGPGPANYLAYRGLSAKAAADGVRHVVNRNFVPTAISGANVNNTWRNWFVSYVPLA